MREEILPRAALELLEPIVRLDIEVPSEFQGGVVGNLSRKRADIDSTHDEDGACIIEARVPLAEMLDYANEIRSLTQGKGTFTMVPSGYKATPKRVVDQLLRRELHVKVKAG